MQNPPQWLNPKWPLDPARSRMYYGWSILAVSTFAMLGAVPGSPPGLSPFLEPMLEAFQIERSHITFAYMIGTFAAGLLTWRVGAVFDRVDSRGLATFAFIGLGMALVLTGQSSRIYGLLGPPGQTSPWVAAAILASCFFLIRFFGLGVMMTICRSLLARWFTRNRSFAVSINGVVMSLSFSSAPVLLFYLVDAVGWQGAWTQLGIVFALLFSIVIYIFVRHSPEQAGVPVEPANKPGTQAPFPKGHSGRGEWHFPIYRDFTTGEAARTFTFWIFVIGLALNGVIGTGITINLVSVGLEKGLSEQAALSLLLPASLVNIAVTLTLGAIGHKIDLRWVLCLLLAGLVAECTGALILDSWTGRILYSAGGGTAWGCFGILITLPWPRYFGSRHIGSINGVVTGMTVVTSAVGPYIFGQVKDVSGSYTYALAGCLVVIPLVLAGSIFAGNPQSGFRGKEAS